jgi:hypothetical protein
MAQAASSVREIADVIGVTQFLVQSDEGVTQDLSLRGAIG